jgi:hypothetical protein
MFSSLFSVRERFVVLDSAVSAARFSAAAALIRTDQPFSSFTQVPWGLAGLSEAGKNKQKISVLHLIPEGVFPPKI